MVMKKKHTNLLAALREVRELMRKQNETRRKNKGNTERVKQARFKPENSC